jgi:cation diffusion facilitator CzcD-associated flavoprotein CzcO
VPVVDRSSAFCVIGAGSSGLAVAKNFSQLGIPFDCIEREDDVGGNWYYGKPASSVYQSTHLISSKRLTEYTDFPMPADWPHYPRHDQVWQYFRAYAQHFGLYEKIEFNRAIERVEPSGTGWQVTLSGSETRQYRGVVIANGHNWDPKWPTYPGQFDGLVLHSCQYKTPEVLRGKRVLVVGAGNSGCDIAVESAQQAAATFHSSRRGYHYLPKFLNGKPADVCGERLLRWRLPTWLRRMIAARLVKMAIGRPQDYGLPAPDHKLFETHPIINSQMLYYVGHGQIKAKPDVQELKHDRVRFVDGSDEPIDVIIYATGFRISFPFIEREYLNWQGDRPKLFLNIFHPQRDDLFVCGLIQPDSGQWGLVDYQAQLIARYLVAIDRHPADANQLRQLKSTAHEDLGSGIRYVESSRHLLEVEHFGYRERLKKMIAKLPAA